MRKLRKPLSILLSIVMILSVFTIVPLSASAQTVQIFARKWVKADLVTGDYFSFSDLYQNFIVCRVEPELFDETDFSTTQQGVYNRTVDQTLGYGNEFRLDHYDGNLMRGYWQTDYSTSGDGKLYLSTNGDGTNFNTDGVEWYAYTWETFEANKVDAVAPTYSDGVYTNGTSEYYTAGSRLFAPISGTTDGHQNVKQIPDTDELAVPYFEFSDDGTQLCGYNGTDAVITLPETIPDTYPVAEWRGESYGIIKDEAFMGNSTITKVTMPENVTHIGVSAFEDCTNLQEVYAGSELSYIDLRAFKDCPSLIKFYSATPYAEDETHVDQLAFDDEYGTSLTLYCRHGSFLDQNTIEIHYSYISVSYIDHTVIWNNWNDDQLEKDQYVLEGEMPKYDGATPVRRNSDHKLYTFTGWSPAVAPVTGDVTYTAQYTFADDSKTATYIDADGTQKTVTATILGGHEQYEYYDYTYTYWLGEDGQTTWYVVEDDIVYDETLGAPIRIKGDVNLIIEDGASLTADYLSTPHNDAARSLTVYGQANQTGEFTIGSVEEFYQFDALNICGANTCIGSIGYVDQLNVVRGTLDVDAAVSAEKITLGCATAADSITLGSIIIDNILEYVKIADGQTLEDDERTYTGTLEADDINDLAGKTLVKAHEHDKATMTHHDAVIPTYDPDTDTYTSGTHEYYECPNCGGCFVEEDGELVQKTADELNLPYYIFWKMPSVSGVCYLRAYNGADADVIIPDTVPESLASQQTPAGTPITHIDNHVFANHEELETVTTGTSLCSIGAGAFAGCTLLTEFNSTAAQKVNYVYNDPNDLQDSFADVDYLTIYATHASELYDAAQDYNFTFIPTDRHPDPTWEWATDYSGATAHFDCSGCSYEADLHADAIITQNDGLTEYTVTVTTTDGYTYTDSRNSTTKFVHYIDEDGEDEVVEAKIITGNEASLGEAGKFSWYVVEGDIDFDGASLTINGNTCLILADGVSLTGIDTISSADEDDTSDLYIYGQMGQTGKMSTGTLEDLHSVIVYGGSLEVDELNASIVSVTGGSLNAGSISAINLSVLGGALNTGDITVSNRTRFIGGNTNVTGTAQVNAVYLGWTNEDDSITVREYLFSDNTETFVVINPKILVDGMYTYKGRLTFAGRNNDASHMAGRTLVPAHEHSADEMTLHTASAPTYDPHTKTYTNGNIEYYTCDKCGGCLVEDGNGGFVYIDPVDTQIPYFRFETKTTLGITTCDVVGYNGTDADVIIPDCVPTNYPDSSQRGNTVTGVSSSAFKNNTQITSVTMGDDLRDIGEDAFRGCTALTTVTAGSSLGSIGHGAFIGCSALESFTSDSDIAIRYWHNTNADSFDTDSGITFYGPHGSALLYIARDFSDFFVPTDRHVEPTWTWAADYSSATAVFDCDGKCERSGGNDNTFTASIEAEEIATGMQYTASVTVDGETYTDVKKTSYWKELQAEIDSKPDDLLSLITLSHDIVADTDDVPLVIPEGKQIMMMFNGHTINRSLDEAVANGNVITVNGKIAMMGTGTVTGGKNTENGGAIVNNGTLTVGGVTISGNVTLKDGGAVYSSGKLTVSSGTISGNSAGTDGHGSGGAISAHSGTITIEGGYIIENTAENHGGAIYLGEKNGNTATLYLKGGDIVDNTAGGQGGGILHNGAMYVEGRPSVYRNTAATGNNIFLRTDKMIGLSDTLLCDNSMGITRQNNATGNITSGSANTTTYKGFFSDNPDYYITDNGAGEATLQRYYVFSFNAGGGSGTQDVVRSTTNEIELPDCTFDAPENAVFKAWNDGGTLKQPGQSALITSGYTKTITAIWTPLHAITVGSISHGTVETDKDRAAQGATITLTVTPDEGYALDYVEVQNDNTGLLVVVNDNQFIMPGSSVTITAVFRATTPYVNAQGEDMTPVLAESIDVGATTWSDEWIYVNSEMTINNRVTITGVVNLILCDGAELNIPKGITVNAANSSDLTIWCQKNGTGTLNITAPDIGNAGIGGVNNNNSSSGDEYTGGTLTINGGVINTVGSSDGSGIGAGRVSGSPVECTIAINGGTVTAEGTGNFGAGIGCIRGEINITGGTVNAAGHDYAPGIGVSDQSYFDPNDLLRINISGGKVTATGGYCAAGIGGVVSRGGGAITISGGEVTAIGGGRMSNDQTPGVPGIQNNFAGAGIGSGAGGNPYYNVSTVINITGGKINAKGGCYKDSDESVAAGIGIGELRPNMTGGSGDAETTLTWTDDSMETMSVTSTGYNGSVTLAKSFVDLDGTIYNADTEALSNPAILANTPLRPYDGMGVTLAGYTISLDGDIAVNFYMELSSDILDHPDAYMQFTVQDTGAEYQDQKVYVKAKEGENRSVAATVDDLTPGKTYYVFKCKVTAKNMASEIRAQLIDGDDHSIIYTYSVKDYADYLLAHADANGTAQEKAYAKAAPLVKAMLNYGTAAQIYFETNIDKPANGGMSADDRTIQNVTADMINKPYNGNAELPDGVTFTKVTLSVKSETTLSLYFRNAGGKDLTFSCAGKTVEVEHTGTTWVARIRGVKAKELGNDFTLTVSDGTSEGFVTYCPMTYCYNVLNRGTDEENLPEVVKALYWYWKAAEVYFD